MTSVGGTTRRNSSHNSSGTSRSTKSVMHSSTNARAIRNDVLEVVFIFSAWLSGDFRACDRGAVVARGVLDGC
ncbi:hypothetical protein ACFV0H_39070, partial [Streptomyces erythrochromogenes]|uniref:hypothetical protein n=1 Tax=Streptomyces erythrochromogenes TaxID=285574 RepID=UPI00367C88F4